MENKRQGISSYLKKIFTMENELQIKRNFLVFLLLFGFIGFILSGTSYLMHSDYVLGIILYCGGLMSVLTFIILIKIKKYLLVNRLVICTLLILILYLIFSDKILFTTRVMLYVFPLLALFLLGIKEGTVFSIIILIILLMDLNDKHQISIIESHSSQYMRFTFTFIAIYLLGLIYEYIRRKSYDKIISANNIMQINVKNLEEADKKIKESNDYMNRIFNVIPSAIIVVDKDQRIVSLNRMALDILGYSEEEIVGKTCYTFTLMPCTETCILFNNKVKMPVKARVCNIKTKTGEIRIISKNVDNLYDSDGNVIGGVESFEDITERQLKDEEIRKLSYAVSQSPASIVITDVKGSIEYVNSKFTEISGYSFDEAIGQNPRILKSGEKSDSEYKMLWDTITGGKEWRGEFHNKRKSGALYWELASISSIRNERGDVTHFVAVKEDITERKKLEKELYESKEKAESATKAKSEFLANMSHEIRTPMNGIIGMTDLLVNTELDKEQDEYAMIIKQSALTLLTLINDILDFSKIESGKMEFENIEFDLYEMIGISVKPLQVEIAKKRLELVIDIENDVPRFIKSDPTRIKQVLLNLIGNSIKFTNIGEIVLSVKTGECDSQKVNLEFNISDTGIGIDEDKIEKIFSPFEQGDSSITRKYGGTGLGTTISKLIVEKLGGSIFVKSPSELDKNGGRGKGSSFTFNIIAEPSNLKCAMDEIIPEVSFQKFIVVDDNPVNLKILMKMLHRWGVSANGFLNTKDALMHLQIVKDYTLALVDYNIDELDGVELVKKMRAVLNKKINAIMLSSSFIQDDMKKCKDADIDICLQKPVTQSTLFDTIVEIISTKHKTFERTETVSAGIKKSSNPLKILLAEDNLVNQKVAKYMLEKMGHYVVIASDGNEVLQKMAKEPYEIILMDVQMPHMDGLTATKIIREYEANVMSNKKSAYIFKIDSIPVPIIALTAHAMQEDRIMCLNAGMSDYLSKPLKVEDMEIALARWGKN